MALTVYAENMGLFHKGSGGKGVAPGDVCLSPPPPPTGPAPVPYVNTLSAGDLADGSKTVKIDGEPTALEDSSNISTSTGDEGGTQGGNVVTHKTKGKGYFSHWSFTVLIEGKGVDRHGDPLGQNCTSYPPGCIDMSAIVAFEALYAAKGPCKKANPRNAGTTKKQKKAVKGGPCWQCGRKTSGRKNRTKFTPDHQPPQSRAWYLGGCHATKAEWKAWVKATTSVAPHCKGCSDKQGGKLSNATIADLRNKNIIF